MKVVFLILSLITFTYILILAINKVGVKYSNLQKCLFWLLPKGILTVAIIYMFKSYCDLFIGTQELSRTEFFIEVLSNDKTYSTLVNFFALLTFYQFLEDRYKKNYARPFKKLSELEVISKDVHNQILKRECDEITKKYKAKIKELKRKLDE